MKILSPRFHGCLDYVVVLAFLIAPTAFRFFGLPATISYTLAVIHLLLTLFTAFPLGLIKAIPFTIHGALELMVSFTLVLLPWLLGFAIEPPARNFYVIAGVMIFLVWSVTEYKAEGADTVA
jgi:hypothetical protein